jgi:hypothetical protein
MRRIDELHLKFPFYGSRKLTHCLKGVNRTHVQRLMPLMGIEGMAPGGDASTTPTFVESGAALSDQQSAFSTADFMCEQCR